jgi:hypothetical protein
VRRRIKGMGQRVIGNATALYSTVIGNANPARRFGPEEGPARTALRRRVIRIKTEQGITPICSATEPDSAHPKLAPRPPRPCLFSCCGLASRARHSPEARSVVLRLSVLIRLTPSSEWPFVQVLPFAALEGRPFASLEGRRSAQDDSIWCAVLCAPLCSSAPSAVKLFCTLR